MTARPLIGVTGRKKADLPENDCCTVPREYFEAVRTSGGLPLLIPQFATREECAQYAELLDGMLFIGGPDLPPELYQEKMIPEIKLLAPELVESLTAMAQIVLSRPMPVLGICLGCQLLNVVSGGKLIRHLGDLTPRHRHAGAPVVDEYHPAEILPGSRLAEILGPGTHTVNSCHHQAIDPEYLGNNWRVTAWDGPTVEAIEQQCDVFRMGLQWHPERISDLVQRRKIFDAFIHACAENRARREQQK